MDMDERFEWRETYFILFSSAKRPGLQQIEKTVRKLGSHFEFSGAEMDDDGLLETLHIRSPEDHSALEIDYLVGDEVRMQIDELVKQMRGETAERAKLDRMKKCDARFEVMHFEEVSDGGDRDDPDEEFDPSALLVVLEALVDLTGGVGVDPQSGTLL